MAVSDFTPVMIHQTHPSLFRDGSEHQLAVFPVIPWGGWDWWLNPQIWSNLEKSTWVTWGLAMVGVMLSGWPGKKGAYSAVRWVESWVLSHGHFTDHPSLVIWYLVSDHVSLAVAVSLSPNDMFEMAVLQNSAIRIQHPDFLSVSWGDETQRHRWDPVGLNFRHLWLARLFLGPWFLWLPGQKLDFIWLTHWVGDVYAITRVPSMRWIYEPLPAPVLRHSYFNLHHGLNIEGAGRSVAHSQVLQHWNCILDCWKRLFFSQSLQ